VLSGTPNLTQAGLNSSTITLTDSQGAERTFSLKSYSFQAGRPLQGFGNHESRTIIEASASFRFGDASQTIDLFVPFTTEVGAESISRVIDLTPTGSPAPWMGTFNGEGALSAFNFLEDRDLGQWRKVGEVGDWTLLMSRFIFKVASTENAFAGQQ
jgi:hypothetical protein